MFEESKSENIRALKAFIMDFERIYGAWEKSDVPTDDIGEVLYASGGISFESRGEKFKKDSEFGDVAISQIMREKYIRFNSVYELLSIKNWLLEGIWNETHFITEIKDRFCVENLSAEQRMLIYPFWHLEQEDIDNGFPAALEKAYKGDLTFRELISLLSIIKLIEENEICPDIVVDYSKMIEGLDKREMLIRQGKIKEKAPGMFIGPKELAKMDTNAYALYSKIEKIEDRINAWEDRHKFIDFVSNSIDDSIYKLKGHYMVSFDDELLELFFKHYVEKNSEGKRQMIMLLNGLRFDDDRVSYPQDLEKTISNLKRLENMLEKYREEQIGITKAIVKQSINAVKDMIERVNRGRKNF